ncbi:MAG: hypothetical protein IJS99_08885 [Synergistaceae bacterium]|nr:hypothetical protein [Synergistaceae bacterium]
MKFSSSSKIFYWLGMFIIFSVIVSSGCGGSSSNFYYPDTQDVTSGDQDVVSDDQQQEQEQEQQQESSSLTFDPSNYTTGTVNGVSYRAYSNIVYVANPVNSSYQQLSIYIPETYFSGGTLNGYTAETAPIFMPNNVGGYMKGGISSPDGRNSSSLSTALSKGLVVVSAALRGRDTDYGTAPACIVDYKAAVRYLRYNKNNLPAGNTDKIISSGTSAGGAISALLGATGNSSDYNTWLNELGAANASDDIFASMCYCPITNLDNADMAYEWVFGGDSGISATLKSNFVSYVNNLGLKNGSTSLTLNSDGSGSFKQYIESVYLKSAQDAINSGETVNVSWITMSGNNAVSADLDAYSASFTSRQKNAPAFDQLDMGSAENNEFGDKHFTEFAYNNSTASNPLMADSAIIKAMNPMNYIGSANTAKYWRIRHGTKDRDTVLAIPAILALKLSENGCNVDFASPWDTGHGGDYDLDELFSWIDSICK